MRVTILLATLAVSGLAATASAQSSLTLARTPSGPVQVGDTITISVMVQPASGQPIRGGGAEIAFPTAVFELQNAPLEGGNATAAVTRPGDLNPYTGSIPPPWLRFNEETAMLQLPIVQPEGMLGAESSFAGTVATFQLLIKAQTTNAPIDATDASRLVPGSSTNLNDLLVTIEEGGLPSGPRVLTSVPDLTVLEATSSALSVSLSASPATSVSVSYVFESGDSDLSVSSSNTLNFDAENFSEPQEVMISAAQDEDLVNGEALLRFSAEGFTPVWVTVREQEQVSDPEANYWQVR